VIVVEGEKKALLTREKTGMVVVTSAFGADSPEKTNWSPLAGKEVWIVIDCNTPGRAYGRRVARLLENLNPKPRVKIISLPGLDEGDDIEQWLERHAPGLTQSEIVEKLEHFAALSAGLPRYDERPTESQRAVDWLREELAGGPIDSRTVEAKYLSAGFSKRTIADAKPIAGVVSKKVGNRWEYRLTVTAKSASQKPRMQGRSKNAKVAVKNADLSITWREGIPSLKEGGGAFFSEACLPPDGPPSMGTNALSGGSPEPLPGGGIGGGECLASSPDPGPVITPDIVATEELPRGVSSPGWLPLAEPGTRSRVDPSPDQRTKSAEGVTAGALPPSNRDSGSPPADPLAAMMSRPLTRRPVITSRGPGQLMWVEGPQAGVLLDDDPERSHAFDRSDVNALPGAGQAADAA
jgi:hypothetical protein